MLLRHVPAYCEEHDGVLAARRGDHVRQLSSHRSAEDPPDEDDEGAHPVHVQTSGDVPLFILRHPMHGIQPSSLHTASSMGCVHTAVTFVPVADLGHISRSHPEE